MRKAPNFANRRAGELLAFDPTSNLRKAMAGFVHDEEILDPVRRCLRSGEGVRNAEAILFSPKPVVVRVDVLPLAERKGRFGGVLVELINDSHTLLLPTSRRQVLAALKSLKTAPMLTGYRGLPVADLESAVDAIMAVADFAASRADRILELDVNPLIVRPEGQGAVAADALIRLAEPE